MPIYAFECSTCGTRFDRLQKLSDADPDTCPECGAHTVKRQLTAPSFRLSGSGWYETDFKKDGDKKRNLAEKAETNPDNKSSDASAASTAAAGESKPKAAETKPAAVEKPAAKPTPKSDA